MIKEPAAAAADLLMILTTAQRQNQLAGVLMRFVNLRWLLIIMKQASCRCVASKPSCSCRSSQSDLNAAA